MYVINVNVIKVGMSMEYCLFFFEEFLDYIVVDIIGVVVGIFIFIFIVCVVIFYFFYCYYEKFFCDYLLLVNEKLFFVNNFLLVEKLFF